MTVIDQVSMLCQFHGDTLFTDHELNQLALVIQSDVGVWIVLHE